MEHESTDQRPIEPGEAVYDRDGGLLGHVSGFTEKGFVIESVDPDNQNSAPGKEIPGQEFGEGYLMWQCGECGEMGELDEGLPETCPDCGAPKENMSYSTED